MQSNFGKSLKSIRKEKGYTLKDLSLKTNLSISFLSQLENSKTSITLQTFSKISDALEVSRSEFFNESKVKQDHLITRKAEDNFQINQANFVYQSLSRNIANPLFESMLVILFPNNYKKTTSSHEGQEFVYILKGVLTVLIDDQESELKEGDSFHIESSTPHTWFNRSEEVVKLLYVQSFPNK